MSAPQAGESVGIEWVLIEHRFGVQGFPARMCACGYQLPLGSDWDLWRAHVAAVLADLLRDRIHETARTSINSVYGTDDRHAYMGLRIAQAVVDNTPLPWRYEPARTEPVMKFAIRNEEGRRTFTSEEIATAVASDPDHGYTLNNSRVIEAFYREDDGLEWVPLPPSIRPGMSGVGDQP